MQNNQLTYRIVTDVAQFADLEPAWESLSVDNPLLSWDWMFSWWSTFAQGGELLIVVVSSGDREIAIVPLYKTITRTGARVVRFIGSGDACTDYTEIICDAQMRDHVEAFVAKAIVEPGPLKRQLARWDQIEIEGHVSSTWSQFFDSLQGNGCTIYTQEIEGSWKTDLGPTFAEYESRLRKSFRRKTRKATKNLQNGSIDFELIRDVNHFDQVWPEFCRLHQLRRQMLGQQGCFSNPQFEPSLLQQGGRHQKARFPFCCVWVHTGLILVPTNCQ